MKIFIFRYVDSKTSDKYYFANRPNPNYSLDCPYTAQGNSHVFFDIPGNFVDTTGKVAREVGEIGP